QFHIKAFAAGHSRTAGIAAHQQAGQVAIGQKENTRRHFTRLGRLTRQLDLSLLRTQPYSIAGTQAQAFHVVGAHEQGTRLLDVAGGKFTLVEGGALATGAARDEDENFSHAALLNAVRFAEGSPALYLIGLPVGINRVGPSHTRPAY